MRGSHFPRIKYREDYTENSYYGNSVSDNLEAAPRLLTPATEWHAQLSQQGSSNSEDEMVDIYHPRRAFGNKGNL